LTSLAAYTDGAVTRQGGADRYETAAAIAEDTYPGGAGVAFIGSGTDISDGMTGAASAAARHRPLLLTDAQEAPVATTVELVREAPHGLVILGGESAVSTSVATALADAIVPDPLPTPTTTPTPTAAPTPRPTATADPAPTPTPTSPPSTGTASSRPYDVESPWNTPIDANVAIDVESLLFMTAINDNNLPLSADPDQYAIPVYLYDNDTPLATVNLSGFFSSYDAGDASRVGYGSNPTVAGVPIPANALQSSGSDGQIVIWNPATGTEYSFWQFVKTKNGSYAATNGVRYHTTAGYYGRFADGLAGRGAGTPYFAGLVRKWEIDQGHIDHALAFAYDSPSNDFRYPASKSDGGNFGGVTGTDLPEGTRLQLDPSLTDADFTAWGLSAPARTIARALQTYGMYVIDHSGSSKIYLEDRLTAKWGSDITRDFVSGIPWTAFRVVAAPAAP
jgi:hypothetical protein